MLSTAGALRLRQIEIEIGKEELAKAGAARMEANVRWLREGNAPTSSFFQKVREKRKADRIVGIRNARGEWVTRKEEVACTIVEGLQSICGQSEKAYVDRTNA